MMRKNKTLSIVVFILWLSIDAAGLPLWFPGKANTDFGGYVKEIPFIEISPGEGGEDAFNLVHFRANTKYYPFNFLSIEASGRLRLFSGRFFPDSLSGVVEAWAERERGYVDLEKVWPSLLLGEIDRAFLAISTGNLSITLGRQRINWGTSFIWNPNDWYNTYNFLDFDYQERPGTDALRIQYYTGVTSVAEIALQAAKEQKDRTLAAMYRFNIFSYDLQFQGGLFGNDAAAGFSWAGQIGGAGFRGEAAFYYPVINVESWNEYIKTVAVMSVDYTFPNSLFLHLEALYNRYGTRGDILVSAAYIDNISAKNLLPSRFGLFGEVSYMFTPLLTGSFAASMNPDDLSFYLAPGIQWSVFQNLDFSAVAQLFFGDDFTLYGDSNHLLAFTFRWSFGS